MSMYNYGFVKCDALRNYLETEKLDHKFEEGAIAILEKCNKEEMDLDLFIESATLLGESLYMNEVMELDLAGPDY